MNEMSLSASFVIEQEATLSTRERARLQALSVLQGHVSRIDTISSVDMEALLRDDTAITAGSRNALIEDPCAE